MAFAQAGAGFSFSAIGSADQTSSSEKASQAAALDGLLSVLLSAGYFRVRSPKLTPFDKVVGGLCWAITGSGVAVNVDVLYDEDLPLGQKSERADSMHRLVTKGSTQASPRSCCSRCRREYREGTTNDGLPRAAAVSPAAGRRLRRHLSRSAVPRQEGARVPQGSASIVVSRLLVCRAAPGVGLCRSLATRSALRPKHTFETRMPWRHLPRRQPGRQAAARLSSNQSTRGSSPRASTGLPLRCGRAHPQRRKPACTRACSSLASAQLRRRLRRLPRGATTQRAAAPPQPPQTSSASLPLYRCGWAAGPPARSLRHRRSHLCSPCSAVCARRGGERATGCPAPRGHHAGADD